MPFRYVVDLLLGTVNVFLDYAVHVDRDTSTMGTFTFSCLLLDRR